MSLENLIKSDSVLCNAQARSKKHCLEILSELLARPIPDIAAEEIFAQLIERERLGCTSLDQGVAFPHCRVGAAHKSCGALIKLSTPVDFDSPDGQAVDLVFGLMVPAELDASHYSDVATITGLLHDDGLRRRLRNTASSSELHAALMSYQQPAAKKLRDVQET
ncbi:MAG: PTS IIA-like nitrogen regulatory protein PtsN [Gammaproteobacteria bacterium]|nr:MAG: PTS IIA-like nitrogen regulatory protein PtsN [Gammaproteobacteria bacterium]